MSGRQSQLTALRAVNSDLYRQLNELRAAKDADLKRITHERDVLCEIRDMSYREIAALKADKERLREADTRMRKALIDIEDDAHAKAVAGLPLNVHSTLMSARYGLGIDSELLSPADDTYDSGKFGAPDNLDRPEFPLNNLLEEPPADGQPCQEFTYMLDSPGLPAECSCFYTYDGKLAKQCDNCRNKPFAPADGGGVEETQWISVKDRLPRINGSPDQMDRLTSDKVLAYAPERHPFTTYLRLDDRNEMGMRTEGKTHKWGLNEYNQNVTHWMPLPEPPTQGRGIEG